MTSLKQRRGLRKSSKRRAMKDDASLPAAGQTQMVSSETHDNIMMMVEEEDLLNDGLKPLSAEDEDDNDNRGNDSRHTRPISTTTTPSPPETDTSTEPLECLLCAETLPLVGNHKRSCCQKICCHECLYRHMTTIWDDALTGGTRPLTCPAGCGRDLSDAEIRGCLHRQHLHWVWEVLGHLIYFGALLLLSVCFLLDHAWWSSTTPGSWHSCRHYQWWRYLLHPQAERRDLERYEQWSVTTGLKSMQRASDNETLVRHCPAPNCGYSWIVANPHHQRRKEVHESRRVFLWYDPLPPESAATSSTRRSRRRNDNNTPSAMDWVEPDFLHFGPGGPPPPEDWDNAKSKADARRMVCAQCHYVFCGLCQLPWRFAARHRHTGRSCASYRRQLPASTSTAELATVAAHTVDARCCPQCRTLTSRIQGCNHMTCPCGKEWCYACGASWNSLHYGCVDRGGDNGNCLIL